MKTVDLPILTFHQWSYLRSELIWIYDHAVPREFHRAKWDRTEGHWAWYIRKGRVTVTAKSGSWTAKAGSWIFVPREVTMQEFSPDIHILSVYFHCQWPSGENIFVNKSGAILAGSEFPQLERAATRLERLVRKYIPDADIRYATQKGNYSLFLRLQRQFYLWLDLWFNARIHCGSSLTRLDIGDDRAMRAVRCLNDAPLTGGFPFSWLTEETGGLSLSHLDRIFVQDFGITTRKYWERRRLQEAKVYLETSMLPIKEIGHRTGFHSDAHFVIWFKRLVGKSPLQYRKSPRDPTRPKRFFN